VSIGLFNEPALGRVSPPTLTLMTEVGTLILVGVAYFTLAALGLRLASINPSAGHNGPFGSCPLYPPKQTFVSALSMSALCY
jgi:hypothetical protein